jgi:MFS family permease
VGPIVAGPMAEKVGWRSFWWLNVGLFALTFFTTVFLFPESKWHRIHPDEVGQSLGSQSAFEIATANTTLKPEEVTTRLENSKADHTTQNRFPDLAASETAQKDPFLGKGGPSKKHFKLFQAADPHSNLWDELFTPWKLLAFPIVQFASFVVSWSASCFLTINLTQSQNFAAPPYNYSSLTIGK